MKGGTAEKKSIDAGENVYILCFNMHLITLFLSYEHTALMSYVGRDCKIVEVTLLSFAKRKSVKNTENKADDRPTPIYVQ